MYYTLRQRFAHIGRSIIVWAVAYACFGVIRFYGIAELPHIQMIRIFDIQAFVFQLLLCAVVTGVMYGSIDILMDKPRIQRLPYGIILSMRIVLHVLMILTVLIALVYSRVKLGIVSEGYFDPDIRDRLSRIIFNKSFYVFVLFFGIVITILDFYQQVKQKFGRGVFFDMILGRYHKPKESDRIFMFIDLRSSVSLAEQLGHIRFSNLIQDCYFDLNTQLSQFNARVYQYVGDQVVLHWTLKDGFDKNNFLKCFYGFMDRLERRKPYYMNKYGIHPYFKASAHMGRVTVAEVGMLKREIAFHGDTVNTTSRIHDFCNRLGQRLIISKNLYDHVKGDPGFQFITLGSHRLKGKNVGMDLFGVWRKNEVPADAIVRTTSQIDELLKATSRELPNSN